MNAMFRFLLTAIFALAIGLLFTELIYAQAPDSAAHHGKGFIDRNGDGLNDRTKDDDGDGIPNGKDPDSVRPEKGKGGMNRAFVDENGDGINDLRQDFDEDGILNRKDPDYLKDHSVPGKRRMGFIDADGDGINDLIQDSDGDGIRNAKDPDWIRPAGPGRGMREAGAKGKK